MNALDLLVLGVGPHAGGPSRHFSPKRRAELLALWRVNVHQGWSL